ncbi:flagellar export protein FliJ [Thaumasiovibrio sp. DFM-14]|uniref:flagellar export protein FliJ n=1 Tax=Thaumasiovibrio sp. DFM-14 TaxID=3384792 RepID=UPI0039A3C1D9
MSRSALQLIYERAEADEKYAQLAVERAHAELTAYHQQLAQIEQYRLDYFSQMSERGQAGLSASAYGHLYRFITQLDETLAQQKAAGAHFEQQVDECQQAYAEKRQYKRSIEWLLDKQATEAVKREQIREQKQLDEFATLQAARRQRRR